MSVTSKLLAQAAEEYISKTKVLDKADHGTCQVLSDMGAELSVDSHDINVRFTGNKATLESYWKALRNAGYEPDDHIGTDKKPSYFSTKWRKDGFTPIYMAFSSNVCRTVQTGTKMVEQAVYETVCDE